MTAFAFVIASTTALLHGTDLFTGWPFQGTSKAYVFVALICGSAIASMCVPVYRELAKYWAAFDRSVFWLILVSLQDAQTPSIQ